MYSLVKRQAEVELLPMAEANGIGVIPTARGGRLLSASISARHRPAQDQQMYEARYGDDWMFDVAENMSPSARSATCIRQHGDRWWFASGRHGAIIGARNVEQLKIRLLRDGQHDAQPAR